MICSLSVTGWETYIPAYFDCPSKEEFEKAVSEAVKAVMPLLEEDEGFIDGHAIHTKVLPILCQKFKYIQIEHEVDLKGECLYDDDYKDEYNNPRPGIVNDDVWDRIIKHNKKVHDELYKDLK